MLCTFKSVFIFLTYYLLSFPLLPTEYQVTNTAVLAVRHKYSLMLWSDTVMCSDIAIINEKIKCLYIYNISVYDRKNHTSDGRKGSISCLLNGNWGWGEHFCWSYVCLWQLSLNFIFPSLGWFNTDTPPLWNYGQLTQVKERGKLSLFWLHIIQLIFLSSQSLAFLCLWPVKSEASCPSRAGCLIWGCCSSCS